MTSSERCPGRDYISRSINHGEAIAFHRCGISKRTRLRQSALSTPSTMMSDARGAVALGSATRQGGGRGEDGQAGKRVSSARKTGPQINAVLERYFGLSQQGTDVRTEFVAGVTTFLTMVYIVFVNPIILGKAGGPGAVFVATCVAAAVSTLVMGLYANYPIALAPGMGINAFFAFTVVLTYKYTWQQALAAVFCSGVLFFLISVFRLRQIVINSIPQNLKLAVSAGVGLFLGIIALEEAKVVVAHPATLVTLGDMTNPSAALMLLGFC